MHVRRGAWVIALAFFAVGCPNKSASKDDSSKSAPDKKKKNKDEKPAKADDDGDDDSEKSKPSTKKKAADDDDDSPKPAASKKGDDDDSDKPAAAASSAKPVLTATPGVHYDPNGYPGGFASACDTKLHGVVKQPEEYANASSCEGKYAPSCEAVLKCCAGDAAFPP